MMATKINVGYILKVVHSIDLDLGSLVPRPFPPPVILNTCSMQIRMGEAWEIWLPVVTSSRHTGSEELTPEALSCNVSPRAGCQSVHKAASILFVAVGTTPCVSTICLPDIIAYHPSIFAYCK